MNSPYLDQSGNQAAHEGEVWDAAVVGGGPAGLAAALLLGRFRRRTIVFDNGQPRNGASAAIHGVPILHGMNAWEFRRETWKEIERYEGVERRDDLVVRASREIGGSRDGEGLFVLETGSGRIARARRVLLATGVEDICPTDIEEFDVYYGRSVYHCPDCDGYESTGKRIGLICWGAIAGPYAMEFLNWTRDITILANGHADTIPAHHWGYLDGWGIPVEPRKLLRFEGENGRLRGVRLDDGGAFRCDLAYFYLGQRPRTELAKQLGCKLNDRGHIEQDHCQRTSVHGVFAAGDVAPPDETVAVAMAEGQVAAITINRSLYEPERWMG